jgi:hypothetical protein
MLGDALLHERMHSGFARRGSRSRSGNLYFRNAGLEIRRGVDLVAGPVADGMLLVRGHETWTAMRVEVEFSSSHSFKA